MKKATVGDIQRAKKSEKKRQMWLACYVVPKGVVVLRWIPLLLLQKCVNWLNFTFTWAVVDHHKHERLLLQSKYKQKVSEGEDSEGVTTSFFPRAVVMGTIFIASSNKRKQRRVETNWHFHRDKKEIAFKKLGKWSIDYLRSGKHFFSVKNQIKMVGNFLVTKKIYKSTIDIYAVLDLC